MRSPLILVAILYCLPFTGMSQPEHGQSGPSSDNFILLKDGPLPGKIILIPNYTGYNNLWFSNSKQHYTDIDLTGNYNGRTVSFQLRFPGQSGQYTIADNRNQTGSQNNDNSCYLLISDKDTYGDGLNAQPGHVMVTVTRYDPAGGHIEGTFTGDLIYNSRDNKAIAVSGKFSVVRAKDKKSF